MKFQMFSAYYLCMPKAPKELRDHIKKYCIVDENNFFFMENPTLETIKEMLDTMPDYASKFGDKPTKVLIDFENFRITLADYYLE